ncbi:MAG: glycogen synthase GlgA [Clostridiales bacterium]|jgi:starch synthase|nr:glycogen synthase GlgA [Clostridiales bacterium]
MTKEISADNRLRVLIVATEVSPYAKSGGLGDVAGSLPKELLRNGVDVRVVMPKYRTIREEYLKNCQYIHSFELHLDWRRQSASIFQLDSDVPTYLIENDYYFGRDGFYGYGDDFERFAFFSKAAVEFLGIVGFKPDIMHFNDWQTGLAPIYLNDQYKKFLFYSDIKTLYTIHNLQYQGVFGRDILGHVDLNDGYFCGGQLEFHGNVSYMKAGLSYADHISTVSETYAREIQTPAFGYGLDGALRYRANALSGILNGIDYDANNPETDKRLYFNFNSESLENKRKNKIELQKALHLPERADVPMFSVISRLVDQKGLDLIAQCMDELMSKDIQFVLLGTGDGRYEHLFRYMAQRYPDKVSANIMFNEDLAQKIYASSDLFLMPSLFEPCGLGQIIAMRYGTVPVVRKTGGLADTVSHYNRETKEGNGFLFEDYLASGLMWAVNQALDAYYSDEWDNVVKNALASDFSWKKSAEKYIELYQSLKG